MPSGDVCIDVLPCDAVGDHHEQDSQGKGVEHTSNKEDMHPIEEHCVARVTMRKQIVMPQNALWCEVPPQIRLQSCEMVLGIGVESLRTIEANVAGV